MAVYVCADIHGELEQFKDILHQIHLKENDSLYILGDCLDRGSHPIGVLQLLMNMPNVVCLLGNHELMALPCLEFMSQNILGKDAEIEDDEVLDHFDTWALNGCKSTMEEFLMLQQEAQQEIIAYIKKMKLYVELCVGGRNYILVHAGLGNFAPDKPLDEYTPEELVWDRSAYTAEYYPDKYVIAGHTPTQKIPDNPNPGYIYYFHHNILIDCASFYSKGRLAAICLDTGEEYYSSGRR
jgi:serine/threonine protein phosphatase 1